MVTNFWNMGVHRKYMSYYSHSSFFIVTNFWNMGIHRKYVSYYSNNSFLWFQIFKIWVYIENICCIIHIVPFYGYKYLKHGCTRELEFIFYLLLKSCARSIFWNLESVLDDSISHYSFEYKTKFEKFLLFRSE